MLKNLKEIIKLLHGCIYKYPSFLDNETLLSHRYMSNSNPGETVL